MINIQKQMQELFGNSCYCYALAYLITETIDIKKLTKYVLQGWYSGAIEDDGYISRPVKYYNDIAVECRKPLIKDVIKVTLSSLSSLPDNNNYVVEYKYGSQSHFVVANKDGIVFDPSGNSNTVSKGRPVSYRKYLG